MKIIKITKEVNLLMAFFLVGKISVSRDLVPKSFQISHDSVTENACLRQNI